MTIDRTLLGKTLFALGISGIGGLIANWLTMPLPWMLGPMIVCTVASLLKLPVNGPNKIRPAMITILGVMLGSGFSPDMLERVGEWTISLAFLAAYVGLGGALCYPYFRKIAGYDRPTAYFAAMPGGLNEMMVIGHEMGGDDRRIVLTHASRILLTVLCIPIFFRLTMHVEMADRSRFGVALMDVSWQDYLLLTSCILGYPAAKFLRIPAPMLVGPMLASAGLHLTGTTATQPPIVIVSLAQWVMGTVIGCRFAGIARREVLRTITMSIGSTAILLGLTAVFAVFVSWLADIPVISVVLAYAPGGLAEMSLVALALGTDVAFVATHHIVRIVYVVIAAPMAYKAWMKRLSKTGS